MATTIALIQAFLYVFLVIIHFRVDRKKGLKIGETYTNDYQAKEFIHYIAEDVRRKMRARLSDVKFICHVRRIPGQCSD